MGDEESDKRTADERADRDPRRLSEENVALRLAWEMRRRGWSQDRMAQELTNAGCPTHQSAISKIVNSKPDGSRRAISVDEAIAMAQVFGIPLEELPLPSEGAEGRDLYNLSRTVTQEGRDAREQYARFILAWARLRHRLSQQDNQAAYKEFLSTRRVDADRSNKAIEAWLAADPWRDVTAAYDVLERSLQTMGSGRDLTPPTQDLRWRHSIVADLLRLRDLFDRRIPASQVRAVPELALDFADVLVRAGMIEVAIPVIDSYERGEPHSTDGVVAEIDKRLQQIIDREPQDRLDYLESLAARIGLHWKGRETRQEQEELAAQLGATPEDYAEAKKIGGIYREIGLR
ncbi:helix-turn-helix domain-containing protein [Nonomuraea turcica]|uniref:helix-turn-helix domain-containing protein n=1 Tax=Nonomuraea sp. G32 TaxID=3067274 RepID=UPI00273AB4CF|nr:helix-turn-helix transcriptional regulator [Nonomuraea sp. G32]MDP4511175.1 helix-turn-helix transcriptional regulator [Nonomuraea sp. G32]